MSLISLNSGFLTFISNDKTLHDDDVKINLKKIIIQKKNYFLDSKKCINPPINAPSNQA